MALYVAYGVLVMHVALGAMQEDRRVFIPLLLGGSFALVARCTLRPPGASAKRRSRSRRLARGRPARLDPGQGGAHRHAPDGERIAVFRDGSQIGALTNLCAHQNGPLGEGRIIDGCVTCPWHGYQYRLEDGCAPPPFTEKLATYPVRLRDGLIEVDPRALPPGTKAAITIGAA